MSETVWHAETKPFTNERFMKNVRQPLLCSKLLSQKMDISIQIITWELPVISVLQKVLPSWAHRLCTAQFQPQSHRLVWGRSLASTYCVCCGDGGILFEMLTADGCVIN